MALHSFVVGYYTNKHANHPQHVFVTGTIVISPLACKIGIV